MAGAVPFHRLYSSASFSILCAFVCLIFLFVFFPLFASSPVFVVSSQQAIGCKEQQKYASRHEERLGDVDQACRYKEEYKDAFPVNSYFHEHKGNKKLWCNGQKHEKCAYKKSDVSRQPISKTNYLKTNLLKQIKKISLNGFLHCIFFTFAKLVNSH